jgi:hypothetical protein
MTTDILKQKSFFFFHFFNFYFTEKENLNGEHSCANETKTEIFSLFFCPLMTRLLCCARVVREMYCRRRLLLLLEIQKQILQTNTRDCCTLVTLHVITVSKCQFQNSSLHHSDGFTRFQVKIFEFHFSRL